MLEIKISLVFILFLYRASIRVEFCFYFPALFFLNAFSGNRKRRKLNRSSWRLIHLILTIQLNELLRYLFYGDFFPFYFQFVENNNKEYVFLCKLFVFFSSILALLALN